MKQLHTVHRPTTPLDNSTYNHIPPTRSAPLPFYAPPSWRRCCRCRRRHRHDNNIVVTTKARHVWLRKCSSARCSSSSTHNMQKKLLPRQVLNYIHVPPHVAVWSYWELCASQQQQRELRKGMLVNAMMLAQDHHHHSTPRRQGWILLGGLTMFSLNESSVSLAVAAIHSLVTAPFTMYIYPIHSLHVGRMDVVVK